MAPPHYIGKARASELGKLRSAKRWGAVAVTPAEGLRAPSSARRDAVGQAIGPGAGPDETPAVAGPMYHHDFSVARTDGRWQITYKTYAHTGGEPPAE